MLDEETRKALPGDELVPSPVTEMTRALTIKAPVREIWHLITKLVNMRQGGCLLQSQAKDIAKGALS